MLARILRVLCLVLAVFMLMLLGRLVLPDSWAQQVTRSVQLSQDPTGFIGVDFSFKHLHFPVGTSPPPVLTACGTAPVVVGTDMAGTVTMGTGTPTGCVITFANPYPTVPSCLVVWQGTPLAAQNWTTTVTAITLVQTATSSNKVNYFCPGI